MTTIHAPAALHSVADALPCPVWAWDADHRLAYINAAAWQHMGLDPALMPVGTALKDAARLFAFQGLFGPGDPEALAAEHLRLDRSRPLRRLLRRADGSCHQLHCAPLPYGGFVSVLVDVSSLSASAAEAQALAQRLEEVLSRLHGGLAVYDQDHALVLHNDAYEKLLGLPRGLMQPGTNYPDLLRELARRGEFANLDPEELLADRAAIDRTLPHRHQRIRPTGQVLQFESQPVAEGGWLVEVTDITAVKRMEDEARQRAALLDTVLEALPLGVVVMGPDMRIRMVNGSYQLIMAGAEAVVGEHRDTLARRRAALGEYGPGEVEALAKANLVPIGTGPRLRRSTRPNGQVIEGRFAPMPDGGYLQVVADITALHQARTEATQRAGILQLMLDHMRHGIALFDDDERLITGNALAARLIGLPPEMMVPGVHMDELRIAQAAVGEFGDAQAAAELIATVRAADRSRPFRYTRHRPNGAVLEIASDPAPGGGYVMTYSDVTARAKAEAAAQQRAETLQAMIDNMRMGIQLYGPDRRLVAANRLAAEIAGVPAAIVVPGAALDDLTAAQYDAASPADRAALAALADQPVHLDRGQPQRHVRKAADGRVLEVRSDPMPDGGFVVSHLDITALVRAEAEAQQRAAMLQTAMDHMRHGIAMFGPDKRLVTANALATQISGVPAALVPGTTLEAILRAHTATGFYDPEGDPEAAVQALVRADRRQPLRNQRWLADGRIIEVCSDPAPDGGFVVTYSDVTARARAEQEARERSHAMQLMLDHMRHGIALYGPDQVLQTTNALFRRLCGLPPGTAMVGRSHAELVREQREAGVFGTGEAAAAIERELLAMERSQPIRHLRQMPDGRIMEVHSDPTGDGGFVVCISDITALATAERDAQHRADLQQAMLDNIQHGIALYGPDQRLRVANRLAGPARGLPDVEQHPGLSLATLVDQQRRSGIFGPEPGASQIAAEVLALDRSRHHRYLRELPHGIITEVTSAPMPDGGFVISHTDITELEQARAAAQSRAALLQAMLDNIQHGIALYDAEGRLVTANHLAADLCNLEPEEMRPGRPMAELLHLQHRRGAFGTGPAAAAFLAETAARDWHQPSRFQRTDIRGRIIDITVNPMPDGGYVLGWSDITPLVQAQAEAAHRAGILQVMMDGMRHGIALFDADQRLVAANRLATQLNDLPRNVNRIGRTLTEIMQEQVDLGRITEDRRQMQQRLDRRQSHRLVVRNIDGPTLEVRSDPTPDGGFVVSYSDVSELTRAQAEAQHRADNLQLALDHMRHGIARFDAGRRAVMFNRLALELNGLEGVAGLVGMHEADVARAMAERGEIDEATVQDVIAVDITRPRRLVRTRPNGTVINFTADPTPDGGYVMTVSDITDLAAAETAASQRATILQVMLENIRHGICYYGPDRRVVAANRLAASFGGHASAAGMVGRSLDELIDEQVTTGAVPPTVHAVAEQARQLDRGKPARHVRPTGDGRMLEVTSDPTPDGGFVVTSTDVTRLVEAETVAQSRASTLQVMLDNIRHGIVLFGANRSIVTVNPVVLQMLELPADALAPGMSVEAFAELLAAHGEFGSGEAAMTGAQITIELDRRQPNRVVRTRPNGMVLEVVSDPTPEGGFVLTYSDVTEDRRIRAEVEAAREAAETANLAKSRFLATMTHELRTPLNAVIGFSEALQTAPDPERSREYLRSILEAGRHLLSLIDDILDVTRAETTGFQIAEGEVDLTSLCEGSVRVMRAAAASGQVALGLELPPHLPAVRADEVRLRQVLLNLLSNAVKFTPPQGRVTLSAGWQPDGWLAVAVRDTGIGVKPEDVPRAFEPFTQLDSSLSRRFPGSGLGLYLSRALAEAQGAKLTLESGGGVGTVAVLRFPPERLVQAGQDQPLFAP